MFQDNIFNEWLESEIIGVMGLIVVFTKLAESLTLIKF